MFWLRPLNNRARLAWITTSAVSLCLALTLWLVSFSVRTQALNRRTEEVNAMLRRVSSEWLEGMSLAEASEDFPGLSISLFDRDGHLRGSIGKGAPALPSGRTIIGQTLTTVIDAKSVLAVGSISLKETEAGLQQLNWVLGALWIPLSAFTALISWYGGGLVLLPVKKLVQSASRLSGLQNGERLETQDRAEFQELTVALNGLLDRIEKSGKLQEQFASDAAHELRTPLTLLRTQAETTLLRGRSGEEYERALRSMLSEIERLSGTVTTLLNSARLKTSDTQPLDITASIETSVLAWLGLHADFRGLLKVVLSPAKAKIAEMELDIVLHNLLDNASRFADKGTDIIVTLEVNEDSLWLCVSNQGLQMTRAEQESAFDRFFRGDEARNRAAGGAGIGLSLVRKIVVSRGGRVDFVDRPGHTVVRVALPLV